MGDTADMMLEGLIDEETGELIDGTAPGYPRSAAHGNLPRNKRITVSSGKVKCPHCGKRVKAVGLKDHMRDAHQAA